MTTGHCNVWLDGCHSQPVPYSNNTGCPIDVCQQEQLETVWNQRDVKSRRVTKRSLLADRHRRLAWWLARRGWNLRTWRNIHWSDESWFLLHVTDGRMRVWRHKYTAYAPRNIQPTVPYGGGSVMVWGVYLSWLQAGFSHHTRKPNWWSVHQRLRSKKNAYCWLIGPKYEPWRGPSRDVVIS